MKFAKRSQNDSHNYLLPLDLHCHLRAMHARHHHFLPNVAGSHWLRPYKQQALSNAYVESISETLEVRRITTRFQPHWANKSATAGATACRPVTQLANIRLAHPTHQGAKPSPPGSSGTISGSGILINGFWHNVFAATAV